MSQSFVITLIVIAALLVFGAAVSFDVFSLNSAIKNGFNNNKKYPLTIEDTVIQVEVANTAVKRVIGLSERESLPFDEGLLFVFNEPGKHPFWMKDMNFSIDIIWVNEHFFVVDVTEGIIPATFPEIFEPIERIKYVLEVNAGFVAKNSVQRGTFVDGLRSIR
ncbi:hypothetical protein CL630_00550 [bacterium]|nr:hypothetical protein [bacterium]|tara:strand:- start:1465 stop:1953 length:489 start_codon:yes stop_codon:yes gene_type:complete